MKLFLTMTLIHTESYLSVKPAKVKINENQKNISTYWQFCIIVIFKASKDLTWVSAGKLGPKMMKNLSQTNVIWEVLGKSRCLLNAYMFNEMLLRLKPRFPISRELLRQTKTKKCNTYYFILKEHVKMSKMIAFHFNLKDSIKMFKSDIFYILFLTSRVLYVQCT